MNNKLISYWKEKSVIITGASSGLGWALVEALAPFQIKFCLLSRREEKMLELAVKLKDSGSSFWIRTCDVRNRADVYNAVKDFHKHTGRIDIVWANSGIGGSSSFERWDWKVIESVIDTNLKGAIYTIRACLEFMVPQKSGAVIGMGSAAAMRGVPGHGIYSLTKIGLDYFMESLAGEFPHLQFTMIHPGFVDTPINQGNSNRIWVMPPEKAAKLMIHAVSRRKRFYIYPFRMHLLYRFIHTLPTGAYLRLIQKVMEKRSIV